MCVNVTISVCDKESELEKSIRIEKIRRNYLLSKNYIIEIYSLNSLNFLLFKDVFKICVCSIKYKYMSLQILEKLIF